MTKRYLKQTTLEKRDDIPLGDIESAPAELILANSLLTNDREAAQGENPGNLEEIPIRENEPALAEPN